MKKNEVKTARVGDISRRKRTNEYYSQAELDSIGANLLKINYIDWYEYDTSSFLEEDKHLRSQLIVIVGVNEPVRLDDYFEVRREIRIQMLEVFKAHGLERTGDRLEDNDTYFYVVLKKRV